MAVTSEATTLWFGDLMSGKGTTSLDTSDAGEFPMTWKARADGETGMSTPEELIAGAHSACFSMAFSNMLAENGTPPESLQVTAAVTFGGGEEGITGSHLLVSAKVPNIDESDFQRIAEEAKKGCPVSRALAGVKITLEASLA
ncbi:OsmC family peroxiredoxin [Ruicaihuangia caeni]|uniref:OsmC family peroxiredoxin n=1 Tax=Ruicaihuangia caeni TaxID=3042517 RepID=A0AAW6TCG9_9MICO|nr:OsmC family peroxiredoxin [Klugiella sp. YN-L-19]MDI2099715.1 OsmC family peroxiredoxin [Klugiella sp. YN-L-19]